MTRPPSAEQAFDPINLARYSAPAVSFPLGEAQPILTILFIEYCSALLRFATYCPEGAHIFEACNS